MRNFFPPKTKKSIKKGKTRETSFIRLAVSQSSDFLRGRVVRENGRNNGPTLAPRGGQSPVLLQSHLQLQRVRLGDRDRLPGGVLPFRNVGRGEDNDERGVLEETATAVTAMICGGMCGVFLAMESSAGRLMGFRK